MLGWGAALLSGRRTANEIMSDVHLRFLSEMRPTEAIPVYKLLTRRTDETWRIHLLSKHLDFSFPLFFELEEAFLVCAHGLFIRYFRWHLVDHR